MRIIVNINHFVSFLKTLRGTVVTIFANVEALHDAVSQQRPVFKCLSSHCYIIPYILVGQRVELKLLYITFGERGLI